MKVLFTLLVLCGLAFSAPAQPSIQVRDDAGQLLVLANILWSLRYGPPAPAKPWEGAETLEWTEPSPAPYHSFADPREVEHAEFGLNGVVVRR